MVGVAPPSLGSSHETPPEEPRRGPPQHPPRRPPQRHGTMLGLSPPVVPPAGGAEPISLEPETERAELPPPSPIRGIPVATVTRSDIPARPRPGSEPEIGSIDLALESVVKAGDIASIPPQAEPVDFAARDAVSPEQTLPLNLVAPRLPSLAEEVPLDRTLPLMERPAAAEVAPREPSTQLNQTLPLGQAAPLDLELDARFGELAGSALGDVPAVSIQETQRTPAPVPAYEPPMAPPQVVVAEPAVPIAPIEGPKPRPLGTSPTTAGRTRSAKKGGAFGIVLGSILGVLLLSGGMLALVFWKLPDSDIARALRGLLGEPREPARNESSASAGNAGEPAAHVVATASAGVPTSESPVALPPSAMVTSELVAPVSAEPTGAVPAEPTVAASAEPMVAATGAATAAPEGNEAAEQREDAEQDEDGEEDGREEPAQPGAADEPPASVNRTRLAHLTHLAVRRAEECHLGGRAVGEARAFLTFQPDGRVSDARLEGEPVASAPVAKCVLNNLRAIVIRPYEGPPFTHIAEVELR